MRALLPGGSYESMRIVATVAAPEEYLARLDEAAVAAVFPYGDVTVKAVAGGLAAPSGVALDALGDKGDDMVICVCHVQVRRVDKTASETSSDVFCFSGWLLNVQKHTYNASCRTLKP